MKNKWTPIDEGSVPAGVPLIVTVQSIEGWRGLRYPVYYMLKRNGNGWCFYDCGANNIVHDDILAWMPLPEPYKEDKNG